RLYLATAERARVAAADRYRHALAWKGAVAARQAEERLAADQPDLRPLLEQLRQARAKLAHLASKPPADPKFQPAWLQRFRQAEDDKEQVEVRLAQQSVAYRRARALRRAGAGDVTAALPPGTAVVDFLAYVHGTPPVKPGDKGQVERRLLAFVLAPGR